MTYNLIMIPLVGAFIGWITNYIAVRMLFRPLKAYKIPLINYELQGLVPKRKAELAAKIGETVENDLLSGEEIVMRLESEIEKANLAATVGPLIKARVMTKIPAFIPASVKSMVANLIEEVVQRETPFVINGLLTKMSGEFGKTIKISEMVEEKVKELSLPELEQVILSVASKELKHIEILGAVLGFFVGVVQDLMLLASLHV